MAPNNPLPIHGNEKTMNMNHLILTNIQSSPYFKVNLYELKTYHEVIDEIYYKVDHLEPWEKGSRKTAGQTGMCGGVRGVGAGGIVSSAYCLLYKLFTLRLTRKQLNGLLTHSDSAYIRGLGFMYIRYTQPPQDFWDWYSPYLDDEEELDVKAGGGHNMTIGELVRQWLQKLEWYSTLFPRIPVPVQKSHEMKLREYQGSMVGADPMQEEQEEPGQEPEAEGQPVVEGYGEAERMARIKNSGERDDRRDDRRDNRREERQDDWKRDDGKDEKRDRREERRDDYKRTDRRDDSRRDRDRQGSSSSFDVSREIEREKERQRKEKDKDRDYDRKDRERDNHHRERDRHREDRRHEDREDRHKDREDRYRHRSRSVERTENRKRSKSREQIRSHSKERKHHKSEDRMRSVSPDNKSRDHRHKHKHKHKSRSKDTDARYDR